MIRQDWFRSTSAEEADQPFARHPDWQTARYTLPANSRSTSRHRRARREPKPADRQPFSASSFSRPVSAEGILSASALAGALAPDNPRRSTCYGKLTFLF